MEIPLLEVNIENLKGFATSKSDKIPVKGKLSLAEYYLIFEGEASFGKFGSGEIPEFKFDLTDNDGRRVSCEKVNVRKNNSSGEFDAILTKALIVKGEIRDDDDVEIYNILLSKRFHGVNSLSSITPSTMLIKKGFSEIPNSSGILYSKLPFKDSQDYNNKLDRFYSLFSLANANFVAMPYKLTWKDKDNYIIELNISTYSVDGDGIFYLECPNEIQKFVNTAYNNWDKYCMDFNLPLLIDYYILIENQKHIESKLLLSSVWMEAIKHDYAKNVKKYKAAGSGYFLKPGTRQKYSFGELVLQVYGHFSVTGGDLSFIKYRNEVIHKGRIDLDFGDKYNQFLLLISSIEKILLGLFGHTGFYWNRFTNDWEKFQ